MSGSNPPFPSKLTQILPLTQDSVDSVEKRNIRSQYFHNEPDNDLKKARAEKILAQIRDLHSGYERYLHHGLNHVMINNLESIKEDFEERKWTFGANIRRVDEISTCIHSDNLQDITKDLILELLGDYLFITRADQ